MIWNSNGKFRSSIFVITWVVNLLFYKFTFLVHFTRTLHSQYQMVSFVVTLKDIVLLVWKFLVNKPNPTTMFLKLQWKICVILVNFTNSTDLIKPNTCFSISEHFTILHCDSFHIFHCRTFFVTFVFCETIVIVFHRKKCNGIKWKQQW